MTDKVKMNAYNHHLHLRGRCSCGLVRTAEEPPLPCLVFICILSSCVGFAFFTSAIFRSRFVVAGRVRAPAAFFERRLGHAPQRIVEVFVGDDQMKDAVGTQLAVDAVSSRRCYTREEELGLGFSSGVCLLGGG